MRDGRVGEHDRQARPFVEPQFRVLVYHAEEAHRLAALRAAPEQAHGQVGLERGVAGEVVLADAVAVEDVLPQVFGDAFRVHQPLVGVNP